MKFRTGIKTKSGYVIEEILGHSSWICVFTTADNQLRWEYLENDGKPSEKHNEIIDCFNSLMARIGLLKLSKNDKVIVYKLLGKSLFSGINSQASKKPENYFIRAQNLITQLEEKSHGSKDAVIPSLDKVTLSWFASNLTMGAWGAMLTLLFAVFLAGVTIGDTTFVREILKRDTPSNQDEPKSEKIIENQKSNIRKLEVSLAKYKKLAERSIQHRWIPTVNGTSCKSVCITNNSLAVTTNGLSSPSNTNYFICSAGASRKPGFNSQDNNFECGISTGEAGNQSQSNFDCLCESLTH